MNKNTPDLTFGTYTVNPSAEQLGNDYEEALEERELHQPH